MVNKTKINTACVWSFSTDVLMSSRPAWLLINTFNVVRQDDSSPPWEVND